MGAVGHFVLMHPRVQEALVEINKRFISWGLCLRMIAFSQIGGINIIFSVYPVGLA